jgi:hypothetical protein
MLYLYAITDRPDVVPLCGVGLGDQPIFCCQEGAISAVVSQIEPQALVAGAAQIWRHEAVVEILAAAGGALPVRFGSLLADEGAVRALLCEQRDAFVAGLGRVRGRVELSLRAIWAYPPPAPPPPTADPPRTGRAYIEQRLAEERATAQRRMCAEQIADEIYARLDHYAAASVRKLLPSERMLLSAAYLVARADVPHFQADIAAISAERPDIRLLCTGPWPAYHFVAPAS